MKQAIERAIMVLLAKITEDINSEDALRLTQAALNLQQVLSIKHNIHLEEKQ